MPDRLRALKRFSYAGRAYGPGDVFIASAPDAKALIAGNSPAAERFDEDVPALLAPPMREFSLDEVAAVVVHTKELTQADLVPPKRKRGRPRKSEYLTRDMRAEE